CVQGLEFPWTF
nr:immunoglobulin light chain junction region [Macaca mulatta]